jgi:hypothetical protein
MRYHTHKLLNTFGARLSPHPSNMIAVNQDTPSIIHISKVGHVIDLSCVAYRRLAFGASYTDEIIEHRAEIKRVLAAIIARHLASRLAANGEGMREALRTASRILSVYGALESYQQEREANSNIFRSWIMEDKGASARQAAKVVEAALTAHGNGKAGE